MKIGLPYSMESTVIEFEDGRRIAWQSRPAGFGGRFGGGRIWRYELEPVDGGTACARPGTSPRRPARRSGSSGSKARGSGRESMAKTLECIEEIVKT